MYVGFNRWLFQLYVCIWEINKGFGIPYLIVEMLINAYTIMCKWIIINK